MTTERDSVWADGWEQRIHMRLNERGYPHIAQFLAAHPLASYNELAKLLEPDIDVAPVQLERLHYLGAREMPDLLQLAIRDSLARHLHHALRYGWAVGRYWESRVIGDLVAWEESWGNEPWMERVFKQLKQLAPVGWRPLSGQDPILEEAVARASAT